MSYVPLEAGSRLGAISQSDWFAAAGLQFRKRPDTLIIPDPNVRVQAVIDGQGVALNDALLGPELASGTVHRLCEQELADYGYYLAYPAGAMSSPDIEAFAAWIKQQVFEVNRSSASA